MFIDFEDIAGMGVIGILIVGVFVLLGAIPVSLLLCIVVLTGMALMFGQNG